MRQETLIGGSVPQSPEDLGVLEVPGDLDEERGRTSPGLLGVHRSLTRGTPNKITESIVTVLLRLTEEEWTLWVETRRFPMHPCLVYVHWEF